jgi:hypothetical protein
MGLVFTPKIMGLVTADFGNFFFLAETKLLCKFVCNFFICHSATTRWQLSEEEKINFNFKFNFKFKVLVASIFIQHY